MAYQITTPQHGNRNGQEKITSLMELRRILPKEEKFLRNAARYLVRLQNESIAKHGSCGCDSPMWDEIHNVMDCISWEGIHFNIDAKFIAETFLVPLCEDAVIAEA